MCECDIKKWITIKNDQFHQEINTHVYNHVMTVFIPNVLCNIVKDYVGISPIYNNSLFVVTITSTPS